MRKGFKMKLTLLFIFFVAVYVILNAELTMQQRSIPQRNSRTFLRFQRQRQLASLMRVPQIICSYAQYGRWPEFDARLRPLVLQFSRIVFSMNDESIKLYCTQVSRLNQFYRPQGRPREFTLPPAAGARPTNPTRNFFTFRTTPFTPFLFQTTPSFRSFTIPPIPTITTTTQRPFFAQTFATNPPTFATIPQTFTPAPILPFVTVPTTTRNVILPGVTSTSTTTTAAPSSGSGSASSGSASASASSASASASGSAPAANTPAALKIDPGASTFRKFKASNGDIVVHSPYQKQSQFSLRKIQF